MTAHEAEPKPATPEDVAGNLARVRDEIARAARAAGRDPDTVRLVAVSKRQPVEKVIAAYEAGQRLFGENYVQEALTKIGALPPDAAWHLIGHLQSNKTKLVVGRFSCIETVDSLRIAAALERHALKAGLVQDVLLQVNWTHEATKAGVTDPRALRQLLEAVRQSEHLRARGLMTIPDPDLNEDGLRAVFAEMRRLRDALAEESGLDDSFGELSMGMSHDFPLAIAEGATLVRVGTAIFGARE